MSKRFSENVEQNVAERGFLSKALASVVNTCILMNIMEEVPGRRASSQEITVAQPRLWTGYIFLKIIPTLA